MKPSRVLLVSTPIGTLGSGRGGGVELTVTNTAKALSLNGHRVDVMAATGSVIGGVDLIEVSGSEPTSAQNLARDAPVELPVNSIVANYFAEALRRQRHYDVIVNFGYDWLPIYLTAFFETPLVHVVGMSSHSDAFDKAALEALAARPGCIAMHGHVQAATFPFADEVVVIANGLDLANYHVQLAPDPVLGWAARIAPEKGLVEAAEAARRVGLSLRVWGVIDDPTYWDLVLASPGGAVIDYRGFVPTDRLQGELGKVQAMLVTPMWPEAFGNVVIEAAAVGVPVVTFRRGGPAELVRDGVSGFVVEPTVDALTAALARVNEIDRRACRAEAENRFSLAAHADRLEAWLTPFVDR